MSTRHDAEATRSVVVRRTGGRLSLLARALVTCAGALAVLAVLAAVLVTHVAVDAALVAVGSAALVLVVTSFLPRLDDRTPWILISVGMVGVLVVRYLAAATTHPPVVLPAGAYAERPWAAALVVIGLAVVVAGVHRLAAGSLAGVRQGQWQDAALVAVVVTAVVATAFGPHLQTLGLGQLGGTALVARPVMGLLILGTALAAVLVRRHDRDPRLELVLAAGVAFAAGDLASVGVTLELVPPSTALELGIGATRLVTFCLFATAALSPGRPRSEAAPSPRTAQVVMAGVLLTTVALAAADRLGLVAPLPTATLTVLVVAVLGAGVRLVRLSAEVGGLADARHQLRRDDLTGLLNRRGVADAAEHLARGRRPAALVLVDIVTFKDVNDRCGSVVGDEVLRLVARRLERVAGSSAVVARLGADEFSLLLDGADETVAADVAARALEAVRVPLTVADHQLRISAAARLAAVPTGTSVEELRRRAALALLRAKAAGGQAVFDEALDAAARLRERLLDDLRTVLASPGGSSAGRVVAHYQPQVDADGTVSGVEALARWEHPELGLLQPLAFIDLAEEHGLLPGLTEQVLRQAVAETARWRSQGHALRVAVNLSASCLDWPRLLDVVDDVLGQRLVPPGALVLEVTETGLVSDAADGLRVAAELVARGIELSVDDYGTGYSSLAHLNHLPACELKLDRAFTRQLLVDQRTATIVRATIELAHDLGMRLVAEGVEDDATLQAITEIGCDVTQGYWHSRPLPASELTGWLAQRAARAITA